MRQPTPVDPTLDRPVYKQVTDDLRQQIQQGDLAPGETLPGEARLCEMYQVGMNSVRSALAILRAERLVVTEKGVGTRVRDPQEPTVVELPLGDPFRIVLREATEDERRQHRLEPGMMVLVIEQGDEIQTLPALPTTIIQAGGESGDAGGAEAD